MTSDTNESPMPEAQRPTASPSTPAGRQVPKRTWVVGAVAATLAVGAAGLSLARGDDTAPDAGRAGEHRLHRAGRDRRRQG